VEGSRIPTAEYAIPMYRRPADLVTPRRRAPRFVSPNRNINAPKSGVVRRFGRRAAPYYDRAQIENGALGGRHLEICWLKDPIDAFFVHIQGSARVRLDDGTILRLNYAAQNGRPYTPVGRILIQRGLATRETLSMERLREF